MNKKTSPYVLVDQIPNQDINRVLIRTRQITQSILTVVGLVTAVGALGTAVVYEEEIRDKATKAVEYVQNFPKSIGLDH